ncbi:MAG TPA: VTT domain-containing protein [Terriglobia bacterium]|nr:VTT domain-containing protein [Terriglobia bacterium]
MSFLKNLTRNLAHALVLYGALGLFAISLLDSTFIPFPMVNDLLLMHLSSLSPERMLFYVLDCTAASVLGAYVLYAIGHGGGKFFRRKFTPEKMGRAQHWLERNDFAAVLIISLLPAPAPFKLFLVTAGALRMNRLRYGAALVVGRGARFLAEGWLAVRYGARAEAYLKANVAWVSLAVAVAVAAATVAYRLFTRRSSEAT